MIDATIANANSDGWIFDKHNWPDKCPDFVQPTGAHDAYNKGDKVTFEGKHYISLMDGNVYSQAAYLAGWQEQT